MLFAGRTFSADALRGLRRPSHKTQFNSETVTLSKLYSCFHCPAQTLPSTHTMCVSHMHKHVDGCVFSCILAHAFVSFNTTTYLIRRTYFEMQLCQNTFWIDIVLCFILFWAVVHLVFQVLPHHDVKSQRWDSSSFLKLICSDDGPGNVAVVSSGLSCSVDVFFGFKLILFVCSA